MVKLEYMKKIACHIIALCIFLLSGCKETTLLRPYGENDGVAPGAVTNVSVRNFSGGATLIYDLPSDIDLSYVKAVYRNSRDEVCEAMASAYLDSLVLQGFGEEREYEVRLCCYDRFQNASDPVYVTINPTTPPVQLVRKSLTWATDFGGFLIEFENTEKADIGIYIVQKNTATGEMEYYDSYFTEKAEGSYTVRGLPDEENDFGIYIQDKWNNKSDTLLFTTTPYYEEELDKDLWQRVQPEYVPGDITNDELYDPGNSQIEKLWDGEINTWNYFNTLLDLEFPHRFTIDLGVDVLLSRIRIWQRDGSDVAWKHAMWKKFNIWGCSELPDQAGQADNPMQGWTLLGEFESVKPSGSPLGVETDEDMQLIRDGEEFSFNPSNPKIRYIRFEILQAHSSMRSSGMSEISLWGQLDAGEDAENDNE